MSDTPSLPASGHGEVAGLVEERDEIAFLRRALSNISSHAESGDLSHLEFRIKARECADHALANTVAPTPSPVEARADGVRVTSGTDDVLKRAREYRPYNAMNDGPLVADLAAEVSRLSVVVDIQATEIARLAALESPPAQPVREGQEGKAWPIDTDDQVEALARECEWNNRVYMTPADYAIWCERMRKFARLASQPDPAAEIARLRQEIADLRLSDAHICQQAADYLVRAERAESELAVIREALKPFARIAAEISDKTGVPESAISDETFVSLRLGECRIARAALANTADRGQEEKGNG